MSAEPIYPNSRTASAAGLGHLGTQAFRQYLPLMARCCGHGPWPWQKMMWHPDIAPRWTFTGDVIMDEMNTASIKVAELVFRANGAQAERGSG